MIAVANPLLPAIPGAVHFRPFQGGGGGARPTPLRDDDLGGASAEMQAIAAGIARFVGNGSPLQIWLGKAPDALLRALTDRQNLRLHSSALRRDAGIGGGDAGPPPVPPSSVYMWAASRITTG